MQIGGNVCIPWRNGCRIMHSMTMAISTGRTMRLPLAPLVLDPCPEEKGHWCHRLSACLLQ